MRDEDGLGQVAQPGALVRVADGVPPPVTHGRVRRGHVHGDLRWCQAGVPSGLSDVGVKHPGPSPTGRLVSAIGG